ncbi:MAG: hypothetical protein MK132_17545 [Lentisphaerales bacterium]|nr:hypothetical protein [Lentisphaerales bacterium]
MKGQAWAWQRDAQAYGLNEPNTEMIATHDVGEMHDIHPQDKMTVGKRFAQMVAKNAGEKVVAHGPKFKSFVVKGQSIIISFENTYGGLMTKEVRMNHNAKIAPGKDPKAHRASSTELVGFVICGENKTFHEAKAVIKDDKVIVSSPKVSKPLAVRYAWKTFALANLYNKEGLPAYQFRTDNFIMPVIYNAK